MCLRFAAAVAFDVCNCICMHAYIYAQRKSFNSKDYQKVCIDSIEIKVDFRFLTLFRFNLLLLDEFGVYDSIFVFHVDCSFGYFFDSVCALHAHEQTVCRKTITASTAVAEVPIADHWHPTNDHARPSQMRITAFL